MIKLSTILLLVSLALADLVIVVKPSFTSQSSWAQRTFKEPDDDLDEFVGKVKSITVETEEHELTTHFMDFGNRYKRKLFQTTQFDRTGKTVEKFHYRRDGVALPKTTYSYDSNGVLLKESHYSALSGKPYFEIVYVYDSQGKLKEKIDRNIEDNKVFSRKLYSHDLRRNHTEVVEYDSDNIVRGKIGFIWNNQGKATEIISFSPKGEILGKGTITYSEKGYIAEMVYSLSDGSPEKREKYTYDFDGQRNWVKKTLYQWVTEEGKSTYKLMNITHRTIVYY
jgi:hypothetical protein